MVCMKKPFTGLLALLAGACIAHAQTVSMGNYGTGNPYLYVSFNGTLLGGSTTAVSGPAPTLNNYAAEVGNGDEWTVELYGNIGWHDAASTLLPTGETATFADGNIDATPGTWVAYDDGVTDVPNSTGGFQDVTLQLRVWYNDGGNITSYTQALTDGVPTGESATADTYSGGTLPDNKAPLTPTFLPVSELGNFDLSVAATPEPGTMALGVLGASAFLMRLRRKN